jgi:hypothetical protein
MEAVLRSQHDVEVARRVAGEDEDAPWLTIPKALIELDKILTTASKPEALLLAGHREYLVTRLTEATRQLSGVSRAVA